jgi:nucleoside-diphosphate-sugar epimerase
MGRRGCATPPRVKILVTGAGGFVGGAIVQRLVAAGDDVHALVRSDEAARRAEAVGAQPFRGSIGDPNDIATAARSCRLAVHAAAITSHRASPRALSWTNVAGTENVLRAARHVGLARIVHVSCADVTLGGEDRHGWNEDRLPEGPLLDAHARSKRLAEDLALSAPGLEVCAVRPPLIWGAGDTTTLPALCAEALARGGLPLFGDGRNVVAAVHLDNLVDAIVAALDASDVAGRAWHVADAEFLDAGEFYGMISRAAGLPPPRPGSLPLPLSFFLASMRARVGGRGPWPTDLARRALSCQLDVSRATRDLGWSARVTVEEGMASLATWVAAEGGAAALAARVRPPADDASVAAQIRAAAR